MTVITGIVLVIVAAAKAHVIAALFLAALAHPVLAIAFGVCALIAAFLAGQAVKEKVEDLIASHHFNGLTIGILHGVLWEGRFRHMLAEGRSKAKLQLRDALRNGTREIVQNMASKLPKDEASKKPIESQTLETFDSIIESVVMDLGVLEQIRPETA